jgi:hypothetical protein
MLLAVYTNNGGVHVHRILIFIKYWGIQMELGRWIGQHYKNKDK